MWVAGLWRTWVAEFRAGSDSLFEEMEDGSGRTEGGDFDGRGPGPEDSG